MCTIPQTEQHILQSLLHQLWSTGWNKNNGWNQKPKLVIAEMCQYNKYKNTFQEKNYLPSVTAETTSDFGPHPTSVQARTYKKTTTLLIQS